MAKKIVKKKLVVIDGNGSIPELGGISAPILNPTWIEIPTLIRIVNRYKKIYEVNPADKNDRVQLTIRNVRKDNFPEIPGPAPAPVEENETPKKKGKKETPKAEEPKKEEPKVEETTEEKNDAPVSFSSDFTKI